MRIPGQVLQASESASPGGEPLPALAEMVFYTSRHPAMLLDLGLRIRTANRAWYETFLIQPESAEGCLIEKLNVRGWDKGLSRSDFERIISANTTIEDEPAELATSGRGTRTFFLHARRIDTKTGEPAGVYLELEDVTQRESVRVKAASHTSELERSNFELEQFAYVASHDLQEPLRMIASYTQLLSKRYRGQLDSDADDFINFVVDGAHRMQSLIDGLLAYSRVDRRGGNFREIHCEDALAFVQSDLQEAISESQAIITCDPLPTVIADPQQIGQLFQNLLSNAMKFRVPGLPPKIHIGVTRNGGEWQFSVTDNGIGIPADQRKRLFQLFQRLHSRSEYPGTGIGLALCKKIVERHGGKIWLESEPQKWCTLFFTLPAERGESQSPGPPPLEN
jgi:signal transduction histidine kinase